MMDPDLPLSATHEVRDRCLCLHLQRAARRLARRFDAALRPHGLTNGQFSLLMALNRPEGPRIGDLVPLLGMDRTTLTAALKPLERRGLVCSVADAADARARAAESLRQARERLQSLEGEMLVRARDAARETDRYVRDNPWQSLGIAASVGLLLGLLIARR